MNYQHLNMRSGMNNKSYYWVTAIYDGKKVVIGPKATEADAYSFGMEKLDGINFKVTALPTCDKSRAVQMLRAQSLDTTGDLGQSLQKYRHDV